VRIDTDAGLVGWGESWSNFPAWSPYERVRTIRDGVAPLLLGEDARAIAFLHHKLRTSLRLLGNQWGAPGPIWQAISAVDMALWDIKGKSLGQPIHQLWGGRLEGRIPVYASGLGPSNMGKLCEPFLEADVTAYKLKVGFGLETDRHNLTEMRQIIGDKNTLMVDANQGLNPDYAKALVPLLHQHGVEMIEEPFPADELDLIEPFRRWSGLKVAGGENVYGRVRFRRIMEQKVFDLVQPDIAKTGGLTEMLAITQLAEAFNIPYAPHYLGGAVGLVASLHILAAVPGGWRMEMDANPNPLRQEFGADLLNLENGSLAIPQGAGLGIELEADLLEKYRIEL
jgi:L-alanine-DL-glutamate epimerase-like enolase superfamily enzyme